MKYNPAKDLKEVKERITLIQESIKVANTITHAELNAVQGEVQVLKGKIDALEQEIITIGSKIDAIPKRSNL